MNEEIRQLYTICFKGVVSKWWAAYKTVKFLAENWKYDFYKEDCLKYLSKLEGEISTICEDVVHFLLNYSLKKVTSVENRVYVLKTIGDMYRYIAESSVKDRHFQSSSSTYEFYLKANDESIALSPSNPIRLGLILNLSVYYNELCNDVKKAYEISKDAVLKAERYKGEIDEYASHLLKLMRENLKLWQHVEEDLTEEQKEEDNL